MLDQTFYVSETDWGLHVTNSENCLENYESLHTNLKSIIESCVNKGVKRILCESKKVKPMMSIMDLYQLATDLVEWRAHQIRIAYLMPHFVETEDTVFFETAALNRAITIKFFAKKERAIAWLMDG